MTSFRPRLGVHPDRRRAGRARQPRKPRFARRTSTDARSGRRAHDRAASRSEEHGDRPAQRARAAASRPSGTRHDRARARRPRRELGTDARSRSRRSPCAPAPARARSAPTGCPVPSRPPYVAIAARQLADPLVALLLAATAVSFLIGERLEALVIAAIVAPQRRARLRPGSGRGTRRAGIANRDPADGVGDPGGS